MPPNTATSLVMGASDVGETTYQVTVGGRMTGNSRPAPTPKRLAIIPYIGEAMSAFGASQEVENQATNDAWKESHWTYPQPARSTAAAATAARWAFLEAAKEAPAPGANQGSGYFESLASSAAYTYDRQGETPTSILNRVLAKLVKAPYTAAKVRKILSLSAPVAPPAAAKKRHHTSSSTPDEYTPPVEAPALTPWEQITTAATNAGLPAWTPTAAGVVAVGLLGFALWPKRRPATA